MLVRRHGLKVFELVESLRPFASSARGCQMCGRELQGCAGMRQEGHVLNWWGKASQVRFSYSRSRTAKAERWPGG